MSAEKDRTGGTIETPVGGRPPAALLVGGFEGEVLPVPPTGLTDGEVAAIRDALTVYSVIPTTAISDVLAEVCAAVERIISARILPPGAGAS